MSGSIEKLIAATEKLVAATEAQTAAVHKMIEMSGGKVAGGAKTEAPKAEKAEKPAKEAPKASKEKKTTSEDIAAAFGAYLGVKDKDERAERMANVKAIIGYFNVQRATEIAEEDFAEALRYLQQYIDGETPEFDGGDSDGDGDSLV